MTQIEGISGGIEALHSAHTAAAAELGVIRGTVSELRSKVSSDGKVKLDLEMRVSAAESVCANAHRYLLRALSSLQNPLQSLPKSSSWDDAQSSEAESVASLEDLARQTQLAVSKAILCWQSKAEELSDGSAATSGVNNTLTSLKEQLQAATSERNNAVFELERVQLRVSALEDSNQEIESQLGRANRCVDDTRREARELNATIRMLKTNLSALEAEKESLQRQIQSFESIVAQLQVGDLLCFVLCCTRI